MSAQGDNNLDNDTAQDLLFELSSRLSSTILSLLEHPKIHDSEDEPIGQLFAWIEVLFALNESKLLFAVPDHAQLKRLTDDFMPRWEAYHHKIGNKIPSSRKATITNTFTKLNTICELRSGDAIIYHENDIEGGSSHAIKSVLEILNGSVKQ